MIETQTHVLRNDELLGRSPIAGLLTGCGPLAVLGRIGAVIVSTVEAIGWPSSIRARWSWPNVVEEVYKSSGSAPAVTNSDASTAISIVVGPVRVIAAADHPLPNAPLRKMEAPVLSATLNERRLSLTTATTRHAGAEHGASRNRALPAVTLAKPSCLTVPIAGCSSNYFQHPEPLAHKLTGLNHTNTLLRYFSAGGR